MSKKEQRKAPVLRFKGFTDDWEQHKLGELSIIQSGKTPSSHNLKNYYPSEIPWVRTGDLNNDLIISCKKYISKQGAKSLSFLPPNTVLIAMYGGFNQIGRTGLLTFSATINQALASILPNSITNSYFLLELLNKHKNDWRRIAASSRKDPNITKKDIENKNLFFTTKREQKQIENIIFHLSKLISLQQQKNADIINLKKAILDKIFSNSNIQKWRDIRLNKVLSIPVDEPKEVTNIDDIISVKLNTQGISKIPNRSTLKLGSTKYYVRHGGQFIFGKQNFFNGSMAIIPSEYDGKVSSKDVPSLNINKDIVMPYFLWLYLSRPSFYKKTERWATGTGSKRLHIKDLLSLKIYIPNKNEQLRICKLMQSLDTQILKSQKHLKELQSIKKFLLQNMFI